MIDPIVYYIQTNLVAVVILAYMFYVNSRKYQNHATEDRIFSLLIWVAMVFCISDMIAWIADGKNTFWVSLGNAVYIAATPVMSYFWADFMYCKNMGQRIWTSKVGKVLTAVLAVLTLLIATSPWTKFCFYVDEHHTYHRTAGAYIAPIAAWLIIITATAIIVARSMKEYGALKNEAVSNIVSFILPIMVSSIFQMLFYGVTILQVGFTVSLLIVFVNRQGNMISLDELTGLNNRHELNRYYDKLMRSDGVQRVCIYVTDINKFKSINDLYGHIEGDHALRMLAEALRKSVAQADTPWFLARYGGDEFVLVGVNKSVEDIDSIKAHVNAEIDKANTIGGKPYKISLSFGYVEGRFGDGDTVATLMERADAQMYEEKSRYKSQK